MGSALHASFEVTDWDEHEFDRRAGAGKLTLAKVKKSYDGDVSGDSVTQWLMAYAEDGTATFVGLERIDGTIGDRGGTIVLRHVGAFADGVAKADLTVLSGSCSGDLNGTTGTGDFIADPAGRVRLDLASGFQPGRR